MIPLLIITVCPGLLYLSAVVGGRARGELWSPPAIITNFFPMQAAVQQLDLLFVALLYGCLFSGALLAATALVLLAFMAGALLVTVALAASDARRLVAGHAARRAADVAAANLRLARALAVYAVVRAAVRAALVVRPKVAALASRVARARAEGGWPSGRGAMNLLRWGAAGFTFVA